MSHFGSIAPEKTLFDLSTERTLTQNSINIYGVTVANTSGSAVDVEFFDFSGGASNSGIGSFFYIGFARVPANDTTVIDIPFKADKGFAVAAESSTTKVTVYHSNIQGAV